MSFHLAESHAYVAEMSSFTVDTSDSDSESDKFDNSSTVKRSLLDPFGMWNLDADRAPMDTCYQGDFRETRETKLPTDKNLQRFKTFDMQSLFDAASKGDVTQLQGLKKYLRQSSKHLTDPEFKDPSNGKTVLLKAVLNLRAGKNDTIEALLNIAEKTGDLKDFVNSAYTDSYYKGETALHVAVERRSLYLVKLLIQKGADVQAKACGTFFQLHTRPGFYFGELPLSLAACTNQLDIVAFLLENTYQRVDITDTDSEGNMVLHALVEIADNSPENTDFVIMMYDDILKRGANLYPDIKLEEVENNQGLTPLKLAAKTGKLGLFRHMVRREFLDDECRHLSRKFTEWVYGPVYSSLYDLASLDSYEENSALEIIVYGSEIPNRHGLLQIEPLHRLLEEKWNRFASQIFLLNFFVYIVYLGIFTIASYYRMEGEPPFPIENSTMGYLRVIGQLIIVGGALNFLWKGISDFKRKRPNLQSLVLDGYTEFLFLLQAILLILSKVLYFCGRQEYVGFLVLSLALSWVNLLYFSRGSKNMGIYSVMIQRMLLRDIVRFLFVYIIFLLGFSAAVVTLIEESPPHKMVNTTVGLERGSCKRDTFNDIYFTTLELFKFTIGMGDLEFTDHYQYKGVFYMLLTIYIVLTYILLLNMLIALMSETVGKISSEGKSIWKLQRAITILDLERSLPLCLRKRLRSGVVKELGRCPGEDSRRCFRVEEVNWNKWHTNLGIINEDPGSCNITLSASRQKSRRNKERSWRHVVPILRELNRSQTPQDHTSMEISPV